MLAWGFKNFFNVQHDPKTSTKSLKFQDVLCHMKDLIFVLQAIKLQTTSFWKLLITEILLYFKGFTIREIIFR